MTKLCFIDTETTSLRPDRRAWEIAIVSRDPGMADAEHRWFVEADDLDLGNADPMALKIGRFHDRHPEYQPDGDLNPEQTISERAVLREVEDLTRGAHLVGAVVSFDAEVLAGRMRAHGISPSWHYHLVDVEALAAGWMNGRAIQLEMRESTITEAAQWRFASQPPWDSSELSRMVGVHSEVFNRHTALGDAKWARAIYDAITGRTP
jgi:DNA polymerase III epsilon subunit-like protein